MFQSPASSKSRKLFSGTWNKTALVTLLLACAPQTFALSGEPIESTGRGGASSDQFVVENNEQASPIGSGDGTIHVIPALSSPSVKNGEKLSVSAVIKSQKPIAKVEADLGGVVTVELKPKRAAGLGGLPAGGHAGVYEAEWTAAGLEEKIYALKLTVTDVDGHAFTDNSLQFSDPAAGISTSGSTAYPNGGMRHSVSASLDPDVNARCAVVDTANGYAYLGTAPFSSVPGRVVKVALGAGTAPPTRIGTLILNSGENSPYTAVMDAANGYAYFGTYTFPSGQVVKVALGDGAALPTRIGAVTLNDGESHLYSSVGDAVNGYAYFGTNSAPGRVVKVALGAGANPPTRIGAVTLNPGENYLQSAGAEPANGYGYFGTSTSPGQVVKVALGAGTAAPTRIGAVILNAGENQLQSAVVDAANGYAYFGTNDSPGRVVKVALGDGAALPTRIGAVTLNTGENQLWSAVMDTANGYAYFGTQTVPGRIVKVALGAGAAAPLRTGAVSLITENYLLSAVMDAANGNAYFATNTSPAAQFVRISFSQKQMIKGTRLTMPEPGAVEDFRLYSHKASGNVRLGLYDNASPKSLLWQSNAVVNTAADSFVTIPVSSGTPTSLGLATGTYNLVWQIDSTADVPSYIAGAANSGFSVPWSFGSYPSSIADSSATLTSENWTEYLTYSADTAAPTVTAVNVVDNLNVDITFSEPLAAASSTTPANYTVSGSGKGTLANNPASVTQQSTTTYRLTWISGNQLAGNDLTITASGVTDLSGNPIGSPNSATHIGGAVPVSMSGFEFQ